MRLTYRIVTIPEERTRAVVHTREFLQESRAPSVTTHVPSRLREVARRLLPVYSSQGDMFLAHHALSTWFGEPPTAGRSGDGTASSW